MNLAGLFIPHGPVVQLRSSDNKITVGRSSSSPVYSGPLAVLSSSPVTLRRASGGSHAS